MDMYSEKIIKLSVLFYLTSILGYFYELILTYFHNHKLFSYGILNGPWLPIYGTGAVVLMLLSKYKDNPFAVFLLSFILTGLVEFLSGLILLYLFKMRLWDYTGHFLNINGLVCFLSAFFFGLGGLFIIYVLYPLVEKIYDFVNEKILKRILTIITLFFSGDIIATIVN